MRNMTIEKYDSQSQLNQTDFSRLTSSGSMCHSLGTTLTKSNHLWSSVYAETARGALTEDPMPHSQTTSLKSPQCRLLPQPNPRSLKCFNKAVVQAIAQHTCRTLAFVAPYQVSTRAIVLTGAGITLVDLSLTVFS